ncbi:hypothetical protein XYCOK13_01570 [Xylanibacillus composti]|uniref:Uncharacterized protein n=1 Tax=Xylanibacillus composti TaxID=1572762 RepID=A0A8J4GY53_9BACL|nr:hypothetical protein XYCOK13_01570 [Xylanibacillus composti]
MVKGPEKQANELFQELMAAGKGRNHGGQWQSEVKVEEANRFIAMKNQCVARHTLSLM